VSDELGDVLWYAAALAAQLGMTLRGLLILLFRGSIWIDGAGHALLRGNVRGLIL
jgi:hypothetical protein